MLLRLITQIFYDKTHQQKILIKTKYNPGSIYTPPATSHEIENKITNERCSDLHLIVIYNYDSR